MHRPTKIPLLPVTLGLLLIASSAALSGTVTFMIDGEVVGELECESPPHLGYLRLAGRSGFNGSSERTGLFDNAFVELTVPGGGSETVCDDDFAILDGGYWHSFGSPSPRLVTDFGNPEPCLASGGNSAGDSGVRSIEVFTWSLGFDMSADVRVKMPYNFNDVEFGMTNARGVEDGDRGHEIGMQWFGDGWEHGWQYNRLILRTDLETLELTGPALDEWHRFRIVYSPDDEVLEILVPTDGAVYDLCAPDTVAWVSSIDPADGEVLGLYSRTCGGDWEWLGDTVNTGEFVWPSTPCSTGCYRVKIRHATLSSVVDSVTFEVEGPEVPHVEITTPSDSYWGACGPDTIRWASNIPVEAGEVLELSWREQTWAGNHWSPGPWQVIGASVNDGKEAWPDSPCCYDGPPGCNYEVRIVYAPDPSVSDTVWLNLVGGGGGGTGVFVDFTGDAAVPAQVESRIDPVLYTTFSAYVGVCRFGDDPPDGLSSISFAIGIEPGHTVPPSFENLLPGGLEVGSWESGITLASPECVSLDYQAVVYVARMDFFPISEDPWDITILDHPEYPRWLVDCQEPGLVHEYCIWSHGGVFKYPQHGDPDCGPFTAVKATTWGAIKAMYRNR